MFSLFVCTLFPPLELLLPFASAEQLDAFLETFRIVLQIDRPIDLGCSTTEDRQQTTNRLWDY
jgi:hypothetical protein